ncbi:hypothetical protein M728_000096 [Ensifer sp. WSM1721]
MNGPPEAGGKATPQAAFGAIQERFEEKCVTIFRPKLRDFACLTAS